MAEQQTTRETLSVPGHRGLIAIECVLLPVTILAWVAAADGLIARNLFTALLITVLSTWHIVVIPICFMYLIGNPVVMSLVPLVDSSESKAYRRELRERIALSDAEFYARYYEGTEISSETAARVRHELSDFDLLYERALPTDRLYFLYDDLDYADILTLIEQEFRLRFSTADREAVDGTLDNLIRLTHRRIISGKT